MILAQLRASIRAIIRVFTRGPGPMTPPRALIDGVGGGEFRAIGEEFLGLFRQLGGLRPDARVLDVGCGCGRMAVPLTRYLDGGTYEGFDIVEPAVRWCQEHVTPRYPAFRFQMADIRNALYRPDGRDDATTWPFPYADGAFDFVFLTSVFTHLLPPAQEHYVAEIARVLADGGVCFATFFLWNDDASARVDAAPHGLRFGVSGDGYRIVLPSNPEAAVAIPEGHVVARFARHGLTLAAAPYLGTWCRPSGTSFQDIVLARRAAREADVAPP